MTFDEAVTCWKNRTPVKVPRLGDGMHMKIAYVCEKPDKYRTELFMDGSGVIVAHQLVCVEGTVTRYRQNVGRRKMTVPLSSIRLWSAE